MALRNPPQSIKVAIYSAIVRGESGRSVAARFDISHPSALKYAGEAALYLRGLDVVAADPEMSKFLASNVKRQIDNDDVDTRNRILEIVQPMLEEVQDLVQPGEKGPTLTVSARVPESVFYQFKRLAIAEAARRGTEVTISGLLGEVLCAFVETGKVPASQSSFHHSDLIMDEIRAVLAKYGVTRE